MFHLIDNIAAGAEGLVAVSRARAHPDRHVSNREVADAMDARRVFDAKSLYSFGNDPLAFLHRERLKRLVLEVLHAQPFVMVAYEALDRRVTPARRIG